MRYLFLIAFLTLLFTGCKKDKETELIEEKENLEDFELVSESVFTSQNNYTVTGKLKIYKKENQYLFDLDDFSSSTGPDLDVWITKEATPGSFINLGDLKATSGRFSYSYTDVNNELKEFKFLHIWCVKFSVGFGNAPIHLNDN